VKYYQREGLLPEGVRTAPNQVDYGETHVQRIRLIRGLLETGGLTIAATKDVIRALDSEEAPLAETFRTAQHAMTISRNPEIPPTAESRERVQRLAQSRDWAVTDDNPGIDAAARALDSFRAVDFDAPDAFLHAYASAAATVAAADLQVLTTLSDPDLIAELMVVGTVLGDPLFAGLRRLAQQNATHEFFPIDPKRDHS
jgi:DNA-binding transcriptional MerR regulator